MLTSKTGFEYIITLVVVSTCLGFSSSDCKDRFGNIHKVDTTYSDDCLSIKTCRSRGRITLVSRCPPRFAKNCTRYKNPKRNDKAATNCCDILVCHKCPLGRFGGTALCNGRCHCKVQSKCHILSGSCRDANGCAAGYRGLPSCQQKCAAGRYGLECRGTCKCALKLGCHHVTGSCPRPGGCASGYIGKSCQQICPRGKYGNGCRKTCNCKDKNEICRNRDGLCLTGCPSGRIRKTCDQQCANNKFGINCISTCRCLNITERCDVRTGRCRSGCPEGWQPPYCQIGCVNKTFGVNCSQKCHCENEKEPCYDYGGKCYSGCADGYRGNTCQVKTPTNQSQEYRVSSLVIGLASGGVVLPIIVVIVVLLVVCCIKKRRSTPRDNAPKTGASKKTTQDPTPKGHSLRTLPTAPYHTYEDVVGATTEDKTPVQETGNDSYYEGSMVNVDDSGYLMVQSGYEALTKGDKADVCKRGDSIYEEPENIKIKVDEQNYKSKKSNSYKTQLESLPSVTYENINDYSQLDNSVDTIENVSNI